jgi:hypothetical protein
MKRAVIFAVALGCAGVSEESPPAAQTPAVRPHPEEPKPEKSPPERCRVPSMNEVYAGILPPTADRNFFPADDCIAQKHDVIIVLGCPNLPDGKPSQCQIDRADIAIKVRDGGYADKFIVTGAAVHTPYVEADTLHDLLVARGVDASAIVREPQARHTDENIYYSSLIMKERGWRSAFAVSNHPGHFLMTGVCDSNCCVGLGRLTVVKLPNDGPMVAHYALYPWAEPVSESECAAIGGRVRGMCLNLERRNACKDRLRL